VAELNAKKKDRHLQKEDLRSDPPKIVARGEKKTLGKEEGGNY